MIPILSLLVAALAVFVGPFIAWHTTRRQIEAAQAVATAQLVAPMRQAWINELRLLMSSLLSAALHDHVAGCEDGMGTEYTRLAELVQRLEFMLNPYEDLHNDLLSHAHALVRALSMPPSTERDATFARAHELAREKGRAILKTEWNRVKSGVA